MQEMVSSEVLVVLVISGKLYELLQSEEAKHVNWFCSECDMMVMEICNVTAKCERLEKELAEVKLNVDCLRKDTNELKVAKTNTETEIHKIRNAIVEMDSSFHKQVEAQLSFEVEIERFLPLLKL